MLPGKCRFFNEICKSDVLFLLHINDLPSCVNSKVRLFADDCLLYREIKNNQDQIDMQRDLDALMDWGSTWGMKFNAKKCNIMRVSRSRKPLQHFYSLGNEILQEVSDAKYLGIQIDNHGCRYHINISFYNISDSHQTSVYLLQ